MNFEAPKTNIFQSLEQFENPSSTSQTQKTLGWNGPNYVSYQDLSAYYSTPLNTNKAIQNSYIWNKPTYGLQQQLSSYNPIRGWMNPADTTQGTPLYRDGTIFNPYFYSTAPYDIEEDKAAAETITRNIPIGRDTTAMSAFFTTTEQLTPNTSKDMNSPTNPESPHIHFSNFTSTLDPSFVSKSIPTTTTTSTAVSSLPKTSINSGALLNSSLNQNPLTQNIQSFSDNNKKTLYSFPYNNVSVNPASYYSAFKAESVSPLVSDSTAVRGSSTTPLGTNSPSTSQIKQSTKTENTLMPLVPSMEPMESMEPIDRMDSSRTLSNNIDVSMQIRQDSFKVLQSDTEDEKEEKNSCSFEVVPLSELKKKTNPKPKTDQWKEGGNHYCRMGNEIWVRCHNPYCRKWRYIPEEEIPHLKGPFFCVSNYWDPNVSSCSASAYYIPNIRTHKEPISLFEHHKRVCHFEIIPLVRRQ